MQLPLNELVTQEDNAKWKPIFPKNLQYAKEQDLILDLKFFRIFYVPYERILIVSGENKKTGLESRRCF